MYENKPQETESLINRLAELTAKKIQEGGEQVDVTHRVVTKNNTVDRHSLSITRTDSNVAPQIYVDDIIDDIQEGRMDIDEAVDRVTNIYTHNKGEDIDVPVINNETAKENLYAVLINKEANEQLLQEVPHTVVATDLAIVPRFRVSKNSSILVKDELLPQIEMTQSEVIEKAISNTRQANQYDVQSMTDVLSDMMGDDMPDELTDALATDESNEMIIITNKDKHMGAVELFVNEDCKQAVYDKLGEPAYIIPSSTEELIAIPKSSVDDIQYLSLLINDVNYTELQPEEVLSNHPYYMNEELVISIPEELLEQDSIIDNMSEKSNLHMAM